MLSFKSIVFFTCIAFVAAFPAFFRFPQRNQENPEGEPAEPLREGPHPLDQLAPQVASPSYDYGAGGAGGSTDPSSESAEVDNDGGSLGGETAENETPDNEAPEIEEGEAAETAAGDSPDPVEAGGASGANNLGGGPGLVSKGEQSMTGRNVGIVFAVIAAVGLAAGCGYYVYRKRRAAAYGARF